MKTEAMNTEEQRKIKKEKAERRAKRIETRAKRLLKKAQEIEDSWPKDIIHDIAFLTQPGRFPLMRKLKIFGFMEAELKVMLREQEKKRERS